MRYQRHPLDIASLVIGLICLGIVVAWLLPAVGLVSGEDAVWVLPGSLIAAGTVGIALAATRERRTGAHERSEWAQVSATDDWERRTGAHERSEWAPVGGSEWASGWTPEGDTDWIPPVAHPEQTEGGATSQQTDETDQRKEHDDD